jgi:CBS domain-containing protein
MTPHPVVLKEETGLFEAIESVKRKGGRRLPVVDKEGKLVGILTVDDMAYLLGQEMADIAGIIKRSAPDLP